MASLTTASNFIDLDQDIVGSYASAWRHMSELSSHRSGMKMFEFIVVDVYNRTVNMKNFKTRFRLSGPRQEYMWSIYTTLRSMYGNVTYRRLKTLIVEIPEK